MNTTIEYILEVYGISPQVGSIMGGTRLTVSGFGFSSNITDNNVYVGKKHKAQQQETAVLEQVSNMISHRRCVSVCVVTGDAECKLEAASEYELQCVTQSEEKTYTVTNQGFDYSRITF